jgi:hypothetical protein
MKQLLLAIIPLLLVTATITNVYASGIRGDSGGDATDKEHRCWVNGYDSGFAGKYDKDRANECREHEDVYNYNWTWDKGCEDSTRTEAECNELINNPVEIDDFKALKGENDRACYDAGQEDGKAYRPFNEEREDGCYEFNDIGGGYEGGYQFGCEQHTTESTCELMYEEKKYYCPDHPDVGECVDFLHNATNKETVSPYNHCAGMGDPRPGFICVQEKNPEKYCLEYDDPYCKFIGDLCDDEGFVRPESPYCKGVTD